MPASPGEGDVATRGDAVLDARGVEKRFRDNVVPRGIDLALHGGEMLGLVGANGAGKSTLVKIVCGAERADAGTIRVAGETRDFRSVREALSAGIAVAHQQVSIIPALNGAEKIMLGREPLTRGLIDGRALMREARALAERFGVGIDLRRDRARLTIGEHKILDILKALASQPRILILDEPTASLTRREAERLFAFLRDLRARGLAILLISHHLREVADECDRVVVLKDGRKVFDDAPRATTLAEMARMMVGRAIEETRWTSDARPGEAAIALRDLRMAVLHVPDLIVRRGEVVGIAGRLGAGQTALLERLAGMPHMATATEAAIGGRPGLPSSVSEAVAQTIVLIPDNRALKAMLPGLDVGENIAAGSLRHLGRRGVLRDHRIADLGRRIIDRLSIACEGPRQPIGQLSGGNQQKVAFGRWVARVSRPDALRDAIFLLDNPTEGVDIGAKAEIYALVRHSAAGGAAILVSRAEFAELSVLCDRVYCIRDGLMNHQVQRADLSEDRLMIEVN